MFVSPPLRGHSTFNCIERGYVRSLPPRSVVIIAEAWPTWLVICPSLHLVCTTVYCSHTPSRLLWTSYLQNTRWCPFSDLSAASFGSVDLILISGSLAWLPCVLASVPCSLPVLSVLDYTSAPPSRSYGNLHWVKLFHHHAGGVTDGYWFFGSSFRPSVTQLDPSYPRRLRTLLSPTSSSHRPAHPPSSPDESFDVPFVIPIVNLLHPGGLLPVPRCATVLVCCPSVFTSTKWCSRPLTSRELCAAFDLPERFSLDIVAHSGAPRQLPFLRSAPSKLLRRYFLDVIYQGLSGGEVGLSEGNNQVAAISNDVGKSYDVGNKPAEIILSKGNNQVAAIPSIVGDKPAEVMGVIPSTVTATESGHIELPASSPSQDPWLALLLPGEAAGPQQARQKAAKNDDAAVPTELWDKQLWCAPCFDNFTWRRAVEFMDVYDKNPLDVLRNNFLLPYWRKGIGRSWNSYFNSRKQDATYDEAEAALDKKGASLCLHYACRATWWDWPGGSKLFFWRWPADSRNFARDGMRSWIRGDLPSYRVPQRYESDDSVREQMTEKLQNVFDKGYITWGDVKSLTSYFSVPKGEGDIRMVYDGTKCGLNDALWVPSFALPDVDTLLSIVDESTWMADIDIGEMFLNFPLDVFLQPYCGVDVKPYLTTILSWIMWVRCAMGLKPSPYIAIRFMLLASEVIRGDHSDSSNAMHYDMIRLNLPGQENYDPSVPWVSKVISSSNRLAADFVGYVDDLRPVGSSERECNRCARQISCVLGYLGIQDASRKRVGASKNAGVWAGSVVFANETGVGVSCTQEKWEKTKEFISAIRSELKLSDVLHHKTLERQRGFLIYVTRTYPSLVPYLKGIHLTLDSWRPGRDSDGWRLTMAELQNHLDETTPLSDSLKAAPEYVYPSSRLEKDIDTLFLLTAGSTPPKRFVRSKVILSACYGFGDASGSGFGSAVQGNGNLWYRHGIWGTDNNKRTSNYRELRNLVETIEEGVADGSLNGAELFLFTDNTVAEAAFYKGNTSTSKALFDLIVRLRALEMSGSVRLWVIHVSGKRMIDQGVDGLSRGNLIEGVMEGKPMLSYVPLAISCFSDSDGLLEAWLRSWFHTSPVFLNEYDWFTTGHGITGGFRNADGIWTPTSRHTGHFVWSPPPAAGRSAVDQLAISRHKRPSLTHIFMCPRLFTSLWRKRLYKIADCVINIPAGARPFWPISKHEPLIIGLLLPLSSVSPWQHRRSPPVLELERQLRQVWHQPHCDERVVLRKFFQL